jgi:signal peptidase I
VTPLLAAVAAVLVLLAQAAWIRRTFVVVTVAGRSMAPTFEPGDRVLARRAGLGRVKTGDVVIVGPAAGAALEPAPGRHALVIKRLAAVPGDRVPRQAVPALAAVPESTVPPGKMVLLGDAPESSDSRQLGYFDAERLVGRVVRRMSRA